MNTAKTKGDTEIAGLGGDSFPRVRTRSRVEIVIDKLTNSIINGEMRDGELLPAENKLCEMFGISRSILREAIKVLASKGLLEVIQGSGTFVRHPKIDVSLEAVRNFLLTHDFSLNQLMEVRAPMEQEVARLAAHNRTEEHLEAMRKAQETLTNSLSASEERAWADELFHRALMEASGNPLFGILINSINVNLHFRRILAFRHFGVDFVNEEHKEIYEAIVNKDSELAARKMREHMDNTLAHINKINELLANS